MQPRGASSAAFKGNEAYLFCHGPLFTKKACWRACREASKRLTAAAAHAGLCRTATTSLHKNNL